MYTCRFVSRSHKNNVSNSPFFSPSALYSGTWAPCDCDYDCGAFGSNTWHDALPCALGPVLIWNPVANEVKIDVIRVRIENWCWETPQELKKNMTLGCQIYVWIWYLWGRLAISESFTRGAWTPSSWCWCASSISDVFLSIWWHLGFPGFILVQLVLASIYVSDLKGIYLRRQSVY